MKAEIIIAESGEITLNPQAFALLNEPERVTLMYNEDKHLFGLRSGGKDLLVRRQGSNYCINAQGFFRRMRIIVTATFPYEAKLWPRVNSDASKIFPEDALFIDISDLLDESEAFKELMLP